MVDTWWRLDKFEYDWSDAQFRITNMNAIDKSIGWFSSYEEMLLYAYAAGIELTDEKLHVFQHGYEVK